MIQFTILKEILVISTKLEPSFLTGVNSSWWRWRQVLSLEQVPFTVLLRATRSTQPPSGSRRLLPLRLLLVLLGLLFLLCFKTRLLLLLLRRTSSWSCWRMFVLVLLIPIWINLIELDTDWDSS